MRIALLVSVALLCTGCQHGPYGMGAQGMDTHAVGIKAASPPDDTPDCRGSAAGNNADDCTILVDVIETTGGCDAMVVKSQDMVNFARGAKNKWIVWQINKNPGGYRFRRDGIEFRSDAKSNFTNGKAIANGQLFHWRNRNDSEEDRGKYDYVVKVESKTGVQCALRDPRINNE